MARKPRIEVEGGLYHVIVRGNQRQKIFLRREDFLKYLEVLADYKERHQFLLYAYVLMDNHVHLLMETGKTGLAKILQGINQRYTMYFNWKYQTVGHLFQGRYKAILCDKDEYLLALVKYLHLNPVRGGIVRSTEEYAWSSHRKYIGTGQDGLVDIRPVLGMYSGNLGRARLLYRNHMREEVAISREDAYKTVDQRILGSARFVDEVVRTVQKDIVPGKRKHEFDLRDIARGIYQIWGIGLEDLREKGKGTRLTEARRIFTLAAKDYGYKGREIAEFLQKDPAVVTRYLRDPETLREKAERLFVALSTK